MIDKLLGKTEFDDTILTEQEKAIEIALEEQNLDLWVSNCSAENAGSIGRHLSNFSKKIYPLPSHLCFIDAWISDVYSPAISLDKRCKKWVSADINNLRLYLLWKVFQKKVVHNQVYTDNPQVKAQVAYIKSNHEIYHLQGSIKKHLGEDVSIRDLMAMGSDTINGMIKQLKGEGEANAN